MRHTRWIWAPKPQSPPTICPPATVDGSEIFPGSTCTLVAADGTVYQFDGVGPVIYPNSGSGNWEFAANGVPQTTGIALERNTGGQIYYLASRGLASGPFQLWVLWTSSDQPQAVSPSNGPVGNVFVNQATTATYRTANAMIAAAAAGQTLLIPVMPNGIAQWWDGGVVNVANVTVLGANGAILGGPAFQGKASIVALANNLTVRNLTIPYCQNGGPGQGVHQETGTSGLTVDSCTIFNCDDGILTGASTGGTTTVTNTTIYNCGDLSGGLQHGSTHNAYIGNEDAVSVQNVTSYRPISGGHCWKTRAKAGNIGTSSGCIFAQLGGDSTACIDIPCGGTYLVKNSILHRGPNVENNRFTTFGVEITAPGACDMVGRSQSLIFDNCWFIDDGPLNSSATQICQNAFAQTGVIVTLRNGCRVVSNPNTSPVVFGPNVTDDGTTKHYASRAAAIAAGENIPASYSDSLACLPPVPGDSVSSLLSTMVSGQWKRLTGLSQGSFNAAFPSITRNHYDGLFIATSGAQATFTSDAALQTALFGVSGSSEITGISAFSKMGLRAGTSPRAVMTGGGHNNSGFSDILGFDIAAACSSLLTGGSGGTWAMEYPGAAYLPPGSANPAWSNWAGGSDTGTAYVPTSNYLGQHRVTASHGYAGLLWHPSTNLWSHSGIFGFSPSAGASIGSVEVFDDSGSNLTLFSDTTANRTTANGFMFGNAGVDVCDLDGNVYLWIGNATPLAFHLCKWTNPTSAPSLVTVLGLNNNPPDGTQSDALIIPDPINGSTKRALWAYQNNGTFVMITDITGTPIEHSGAGAGTFGSVPTFVGNNLGYCRSIDDTKIIAWDGSGHLFPITPNSNINSWAWAQESVAPSGDVPAVPAGNFCRIVADPARGCYYAGALGDVWIRKP